MLTNLKQKKNKFHCNIHIPHPELTLAFSGSLKIGLSCPCRYLKCLTNNNNNNNNNNFICIAVYTKALYRFTIKKENN